LPTRQPLKDDYRHQIYRLKVKLANNRTFSTVATSKDRLLMVKYFIPDKKTIDINPN
jgi:hypothetical protein